MSQFELEPWEVGPRCQEPPVAAASGVMQGQEWRAVEMRPKCFVVFVHGGQEKGNWTVRQGEDDQPRVWSPQPVKRPFSPNDNLNVGRFFVWDKEIAFVAADGNGSWLNAELRAKLGFVTTASTDMIATSSRETFEFLSEELTRDSDLSFARRWKAGEIDRWASLLGSEEMRASTAQILEAILWEFGDQVEWSESNWRVSHLAPDGAYAHSSSGGMYPDEHLKQLLLPWSRLFAFDLLPKWTQDARQRHRCLEQFYNQPEAFFEVGFREPPTHHERLEARFFLREWLQQNAPDYIKLLS